MELKPGLWIDVEFRHDNKDNQARRVMVMRPVGGPDTAPRRRSLLLPRERTRAAE